MDLGILTDPMNYVAAGVAISAADYTVYRLINKKDTRMSEKERCLSSIDYLLQSETDESVNKESVQYEKNIGTVKKYLLKTGTLKEDLTIEDHLKKVGYNLGRGERLNSLPLKPKMAASAGMTGVYTTLKVAFGSASGWSLLGLAYTVPSFFGGLVVGKYLRNGVDWMTISGEEKKLNDAISDSVKDTPIVDLVTSYAPLVEEISEIDSDGSSITNSQKSSKDFGARIKGIFAKKALEEVLDTTKEKGEELYTKATAKATEVIEDVKNIPENRRQKEEDEKQARQDKFDDITKNR